MYTAYIQYTCIHVLVYIQYTCIYTSICIHVYCIYTSTCWISFQTGAVKPSQKLLTELIEESEEEDAVPNFIRSQCLVLILALLYSSRLYTV